MIPQWSPKWSQVDNGRPSRNMHGRERIACPPPLGSSIFTPFSESDKLTKNCFKKVRFKKHAPKWLPKCPSRDPKRRPKSIKNHHKIVSEPLWVPTGDFYGGYPPKYTQNQQENHPNWATFGQSMDTSSDSETRKQKLAGVPPCISYLLLGVSVGRVPAS